MLQLTDTARDAIRAALARVTPPRAILRIEARIANGRFDYRMSGVDADAVGPADTVLEEPGFRIVLDRDSAERLTNATLDWRESLLESGFRFDNPDEPASPLLPKGRREDLAGPLPDRVRLLLESEINPAIAAHGGRVSLVDVKDNRVFLAFGGGCHGCGMVDVTLKQGIETRLKEVLPEIVEVVDTTDHETGESPYYASTM